MIALNARLSSDLWWPDLPEEGPLDLYLDFGLDRDLISLTEELPFQSFKRAIDHFNEVIYPGCADRIRSLLLYDGNFDLFVFSEDLKERYEGEGYTYFMMNVLSEYLHRLAASLPDDLPLEARFDLGNDLKPSEAARLVSKDLFPYIKPHLHGYQLSSPEASLGIVLPNSLKAHALFDSIIINLNEPYRILYENHITEMWEDLDEIIGFADHLSPMGRRMLQGFEAAGGKCRGRGI